MMNYEDIHSVMEAYYDSPARKATVQAERKRFHLPIFMCEKELYSLPEGITKMFDHINELTTDDKILFSDVQNKMRHLVLSFIYSPWSHHTISHI